VCPSGSSVSPTGAESMAWDAFGGDAVCMTGRVLWQELLYAWQSEQFGNSCGNHW